MNMQICVKSFLPMAYKGIFYHGILEKNKHCFSKISTIVFNKVYTSPIIKIEFWKDIKRKY